MGTLFRRVTLGFNEDFLAVCECISHSLQSVCQRVHQLHHIKEQVKLVCICHGFRLLSVRESRQSAPSRRGTEQGRLPADQSKSSILLRICIVPLRTTGEGVPPGFAMLIEILCFTIALGSFPRSFSHPSVHKRKMRGNRTPSNQTFLNFLFQRCVNLREPVTDGCL